MRVSWRDGWSGFRIDEPSKATWSHVASYITTALCAGTFTCAAALIDVRLCINSESRLLVRTRHVFCSTFPIHTRAHGTYRMGNVNVEGRWSDRQEDR